MYGELSTDLEIEQLTDHDVWIDKHFVIQVLIAGTPHKGADQTENTNQRMQRSALPTGKGPKACPCSPTQCNRASRPGYERLVLAGVGPVARTVENPDQQNKPALALQPVPRKAVHFLQREKLAVRQPTRHKLKKQ